MIDTIIPDSFVVQCPMNESRLVRAAKHCNNCQHFRGLTEITQDEDAQWSKRYRIICGYPRVMKGWEIEE